MGDNCYSLNLDIRNETPDFIGEPLFVTGSFNQWHPEGVFIGTVPPTGKSRRYSISNLPEGMIELKLNRGNWDTLTSTADGKLIGPHVAYAGKDSALNITIEGWRDRFPRSTASPQVHLLDEAFRFPGLNNRKRVWLYLPEGYESSSRRYPVIYMHDGQHVFDEATSTGRTGPLEWEVDETIDASAHKAIVVAIASADSPQGRKNEYLVNSGGFTEQAQGDLYLRDVVYSLKPFVDEKYRTLSDADNTAMVGSSLGGLITLYAGLRYPNVFGALGILSPSIWMDDQLVLLNAIEALTKKEIYGKFKQNYYFYGGMQEIRKGRDAQAVNMTENIEMVARLLQKYNLLNIETHINPKGKHGATYWREEFPRFYAWWHKLLS